jgi:hypothetical protein
MVRDDQPPVPIVLGIRLRIGADQADRRLDVASLVKDPEIELEIGPIVGEVGDDLVELGSER